MKLFSYLYGRVLEWSAHRHAPYYLASISFIESSFFPIPPDVMLISMGLATPNKAWYYALITTVFSVLGGCFGYLLGHFGMDIIQPYLLASSYAPIFEHVQAWFQQWGVWIILLAGFTPIPYKIFTLTAGMMNMLFLPFLVASIIGRGARFFLVSILLTLFGERIESKLKPSVEWLGWILVIAALIAYIVIQYKR